MKKYIFYYGLFWLPFFAVAQSPHPDLHGRFEWLTPLHGVMQPVDFVLKAGKYYETTQKSYAGQQFQLSIHDLQKGNYLYVFVQNSIGTIEWIFPRNYLEQDADHKASPLIRYNNLTFLVPNAEQAFVKSGAGNDFIFILYSPKMLNINDLKSRLQQMEEETRAMTALNKFEKAFRGLLIDWGEINYAPLEPAFKTPATDKIVPLIFKVF
jgi:hypothetical protein